MDTAKFYSVTENGDEIQALSSLAGAALVWSENPGERNVYEVTPQEDKATMHWTRIKEFTPDELTEIVRSSPE